MALKEKLMMFAGALLVATLASLWLMPGGAQAQAPAINFTTLEGETTGFIKLRGKPLLVTFWATDCTTCIAEMPHLVELHHELAPQGFEIVAIAMEYDTIEQVRATQAEKKLPYLISHDSSGQLAKAFGDIRITPTSFLIAPAGQIVQQKLGEWDITHLRQQIIALL